MEHTSRTKHTEYCVTFIPRSRETFIYIGSVWVGRIMHAHCSPLHRDEKYGVFLQLPGLWGPTDRCDTLNLAKLKATEAIKRWLGRFTETPEPPPEQLVRALAKQDKALGLDKPAPKRVHRGRSAPASVKVVRRVRR